MNPGRRKNTIIQIEQFSIEEKTINPIITEIISIIEDTKNNLDVLSGTLPIISLVLALTAI